MGLRLADVTEMPTLREHRHLYDDARAVPAMGNAGSAPSARQALLHRDHQIKADSESGFVNGLIGYAGRQQGLSGQVASCAPARRSSGATLLVEKTASVPATPTDA
jgi:hypothetical protein